MIELPLEGGLISYPMGKEAEGLIIYNSDGFMSAQIMNPDRKNFAGTHYTSATPAEYTEEASTFLAYSGPFYVNEKEHTLSHGMYISLFPNWTGHTQNRIVSFKDGFLHLESGKPFVSNGITVIHKLRWKRADKSNFNF